jgi:hypothetical protein
MNRYSPAQNSKLEIRQITVETHASVLLQDHIANV